jgi:hypothetical protein
MNLSWKRGGWALELMNQPDEEANPYAPPRSAIGATAATSPADLAKRERLRRPRPRAETKVRIVGLGCMVAAVIIVLLFYLYTTNENTIWIVFAAFMAVGGGGPSILGAGLYFFHAWARWCAGLFLALCATVIAGLRWRRLPPLEWAVLNLPPMVMGLGVLASRPAGIICRRSYRIAVAKTPHLRRPLGPLWRFAIVELALVIVVVVMQIVD